MGTSEFSAVVLKKLHAVYPVCAVYTGCDKAAGRGQKAAASPIKELAFALNIPLYQCDNVCCEGLARIKSLEPDIIVTASFGQILSEELLNIPKLCVLNVHASLLPKYRGASPIQYALMNGDAKTGVTIMRTVRKLDAGDMLLKLQTDIFPDDTAGTLSARLAELGGEAIIRAIQRIEIGNAVFVPQSENYATFAPMIKKTDAKINFEKQDFEIYNFVRAMNPKPAAYTVYRDEVIKVFSAVPADFPATCESGVVLAANPKDGIIVSCLDGAVSLATVQSAGGKVMSSQEYMRGHKIEEGVKLGR
jgi:methionyl-tRNA formyltransferase